MRNAIATLSFLPILLVSVSACDTDALPRQASTAPQAAPRPQPSNGRYLVDAERNRVWLLTHEGVFVHDVSRPERVAVALPDWVWVDEAYACPPVVALGPRGEAVITSNVLPTVWRVDPDSFAVSTHPLALDADKDKDVGFSGLVYSRQHGAFLATSQTLGSLWKIDPLLTRAQKIALSGPDACGLSG